jgi:hypothetical protein
MLDDLLLLPESVFLSRGVPHLVSLRFAAVIG